MNYRRLKNPEKDNNIDMKMGRDFFCKKCNSIIKEKDELICICCGEIILSVKINYFLMTDYVINAEKE